MATYSRLIRRLMITSLSIVISRALISPLLTLFLSNKLGLNPQDVGLLLGIAVFSATLLSLYGGYIIDRLDKRQLLILTMLSSGVGLMLLTFAQNLYLVTLVLIIGLYFIAEHGIMNWLVSYATNALEVPMGQAANYTAVFFGCVMVGRLVLSSLVDKLGIYRCLRLFATSAAVLYTAGVLLGAPGLWLLAVSGLLFSILYPTLVMLIPRYWPSHAASSASGLVLSVASLADILFNAVFGSLVDAIGYRTSFLIMPACMVGCTALLWLFFAKAKKLERCD